MNISKNYDVREFVPPEIYQKFGENSVWFVNPKLVEFCEWLTEHFGVKAIVNNWHNGGQYFYSGYRPYSCETGAKESQHRHHNAVDIKIPTFDPEQVREEIRLNFDSLKFKYGITTIEKNCPTWTHVDCRWTDSDKLLEVNYQ